MRLNLQGTNHALYVGRGAGLASDNLAVGFNGQVLIAATGADPKFATLTSTGASITFTTGPNTLNLEAASSTPTTFTGNSGGAISPVANNINILGTTAASGTSPLVTSGAGSTITITAQRSQAIAATDSTKIGLCNFDSASFSVDANGFVTLVGGGASATDLGVDTSVFPGTNPVVPTGGGIITVTGAQVSNGTVGANVIRTKSSAANSMTIEVQRSTAVAATNTIYNGVSHFNSASFSVDGNGFVGLTTDSFTQGSVIFKGATALAEDNANFFYDDTNNRLGLGITTPLDTLHVVGTMQLDHVATENDDHALEIVANANGFSDVKAIDIDYITGAMGAGQDEEALLVNIDESASTGGIIAGYLVLTTAEGSATVNGYETGINVNPIVQQSGTFGNADNILNIAVDVTAALASGGVGGITAFVADNDTFTIGEATSFDELEVILTTPASGAGIAPTFEYSTGPATFAAFGPADGTNGFRNTGSILWDSSTLAGWVTAASGRYEIRITRTRNVLATSPVIDEIQLSATTEFKWDKNGDVNVNSLTLVTPLAVTSGGTGVATLTDHGIMLGSGTGAVTVTAAPTNGQLLIGSTGADPVLASLTSTGGSVTITPGAGTINLEVAAGNDAILTLTGNSGGALSPTAGNINTLGTGSITIAGAGSTLTTQLTGLTANSVMYGLGTATVGLVASGTTGQVLQTNTGAAPTYSTATYPSSTTVSQILYSSATNVVSGLATANRGVLTTGATGIPVITALATDGQVIIGSTAGAPAAATLTAGTGVSITNASNAITVNAVGGGVTWSVVTVNASFTVNTGTIANKAGVLTMTLPATAAIGDIIEITGINTALGWTIAQNANQQILFGTSSTTIGVGGSISSINIRDSLKMVCVVAGSSTRWNVLSSVGSMTIV